MTTVTLEYNERNLKALQTIENFDYATIHQATVQQFFEGYSEADSIYDE
jgi:hypothetical protein